MHLKVPWQTRNGYQNRGTRLQGNVVEKLDVHMHCYAIYMARTPTGARNRQWKRWIPRARNLRNNQPFFRLMFECVGDRAAQGSVPKSRSMKVKRKLMVFWQYLVRTNPEMCVFIWHRTGLPSEKKLRESASGKLRTGINHMNCIVTS